MSDVRIFSTTEALIEAAAAAFIQIADESISRRGVCSVALSGGSTPQPLYAALGSSAYQARLEWERVHLFWGDERHVTATHPDSNYHMVKAALLDEIGIPETNVHRVPAELEIHTAAEQYEAVLRRYFDGVWPRFDLILLGMGEDGHTASLFPHSDGLKGGERWFIPNYAPAKETWRLTLTRNAINAARNILVLVSGESKAGMLADVLFGEKEPDLKPMQYIAPKEGEMIWMLDQAAAGMLPEGNISEIV